MNVTTLDRVLMDAGQLPADEREILEELLRKRRVETWRVETAGEAKKAVAAFRAGKLKSAPVDSVITRLRSAK